MIRHVVLFRWKAEVTDADVAEVSAALSLLPGAIPEILDFQHGRDLAILEGNADYAVSGVFASPESFLIYRNHPVHVAFMTDVLALRLEQRLSVQFHLD